MRDLDFEMKTPKEMLPELQAKVREMGYRPSARDWADGQDAYAFSFESHGPATYGASKVTVHFSVINGKVTVYGAPNVSRET